MSRDQNAPARAALAVVAILTGTVVLLQHLLQREVYFVNKFSLGVDYLEFYRASLEVVGGRSPYAVRRYVTPPLPAYLNVPATWWPFDVVKYYVSFGVLACVLGATLAVRRAVAPPRWREDLAFLAATAGVVVLSYPVYFLFDRGNVDGLVLLLTALGLLALRRSDALAGVLFALAVATKVYPVLVALPLAAQRRWRPLVAMGATLLLLFVAMPGDWIAFVEERLMRRGTQWRLDENGSLACTFVYLGRFVTDAFGIERIPWAQRIAGLYLPVYLGLLGLLVVRDVLDGGVGGERARAQVALYFPFMVAVPKLAYHYELVWLIALIPVAGWYWAAAERRRERFLVALVVAGIALGQFQAVAAAKLVGRLEPSVVPGFGLFLAMIGVVALRWLWRDGTARAR